MSFNVATYADLKKVATGDEIRIDVDVAGIGQKDQKLEWVLGYLKGDK